MNLYEINQKILDAVEFGCDPETGEIIDDTALEKLQMDREEKIENTLLYAKNLAAEAVAIKTEEAALSKRRQTAEKKAEWLKRYVQAVLNGEKFKTPRVAVGYRKTQAVVIDDIDSLPDDFLRIKKEADKTKIKELLKGGEALPGAHLEERQSMNIK